MESEAPSKSSEDLNGEQDSSFDKSPENENSNPSDGNSESPEESKAQHDKQVEDVCIFCQQNEDNEFKFGKLYHLEDSSNGRMITAHHYCLFFASGLCQQGSDNEGIQGFLANDIQKEVSRATRLKCSFCNKKGASVGCCIKKCRQCYHYPCGRDNGSLFRFFNDFVSYCSAHRPTQEFSAAEAMNLSQVNCPVCLDEVPSEPGFDVLKTPCCHNTFLHRDCIQQQALASGFYFFRCPICNNQNEFRDEMRSFGIHVPEQDAAWEREEGAFQELYQRHNRCDVEDCLCPKGNEHSTSQGKWQIVLCDFCGSVGCHLECGRLERPSQDWACSTCRGMLSTDASNGLPLESTPCKNKGRARSAMKLKGKTPRAGIKNKKVKKSTGTIEVDDTDSPSTSRDGTSDDYNTPRKEKKKKKAKKTKDDVKKKKKSSGPPTLTRADLSPVRLSLSGDRPKTPKLSPILDHFVTGKKHNSKGFKRHTFGKNSCSKFKGQPFSFKTSLSQQQKHLEVCGKGGGKLKSQKKGKSGKGSQPTGKEQLPPLTTVEDQGTEEVEQETSSGGKKKVPKSQHAVIFQSQSKLFKRGCSVKAREDLASQFMKRSLATIRGELVTNLPLVRLCKMALVEGEDTELVKASGWKKALISTTQDMQGKKETESQAGLRAHCSRMSMRKRVDKKIVPAQKKKLDQGVTRSTRSKINNDQLKSEILQESAKNILHAVLTGSKPVDVESYLQHRSQKEEIITGEDTKEKEESENPPVILEGEKGRDLPATEDSTVEEIVICSSEEREEKDSRVDMAESEVNKLETEKKQCLRSFSKSSYAGARKGPQETIQQEEELSTKFVSEEGVASSSVLDVTKGKMASSDSVIEKESKAADDKSDKLEARDDVIKNSKEKKIEMKSSVKETKDGKVKSAGDECKLRERTLNADEGSSPRLRSSKGGHINVSVTVAKASKSTSPSSPHVIGTTRKTDKAHKETVQESPSVKVPHTIGLRSSPRLVSSSTVSSVQIVPESITKDKQHEEADVKISSLSCSSPQIAKGSSQKDVKGTCTEGMTTEVHNNLSPHLAAASLRSSPRLRSAEVHGGDRKSRDKLLSGKDGDQKVSVTAEQEEASVKDNVDDVDHSTGDGKPTDSQSNGHEDISIIAVIPNDQKVKKSPQMKCPLAIQQDKKGRDGSASLKRKSEQEISKGEEAMLRKVLKSNFVSYEDLYKNEKSDPGFLKKDSHDEELRGKSVRLSKGNRTGHRRSSSEGSEDIAILGVFKIKPTEQRKTRFEALSQVPAKEKRSTPLLRSDKKKRAKSDGRDVNQEPLKSQVTNGAANSKEDRESNPPSVKSSPSETNVKTKPKAKKTLTDYFQSTEAKKTLDDYFKSTDKRSQLSGKDVKRTVSSVMRKVPNSSSATKANSPSVKTNPSSLTKVVASTHIVKSTSSDVKADQSFHTKPTEDVTFVGIFKKGDLKDNGKQCHVPNTSKDALHNKHGENLSKAGLLNKKLQDQKCTDRGRKTSGVSTTIKMLSFTDRNISEHVKSSVTEIMTQKGVRQESRQASNKQSSGSGNNSVYILSSDYVSRTPSPQRNVSNHFYKTSQYSWPLPKRELDMDIVILDVKSPSTKQAKSRDRLFSDKSKRNLQISNGAFLSLSSSSKEPSAKSCKEQDTVKMATTPQWKKNPNAREFLRGDLKLPSKRKCSEMEGGDTITVELVPYPQKENSNLNTTKQGKALKNNQGGGSSYTKKETAKEDSVSKRRSKRLKKEDSSSCDLLYNLIDEDDIFPQGETKDSQNGQTNEASPQHCKVTGKIHEKVTVEDVRKKQSTPQKRVLLQRPLSLCKVVDADNEGEVAKTSGRKCNSELKVKKPLIVQKISKRQLVM